MPCIWDGSTIEDIKEMNHYAWLGENINKFIQALPELNDSLNVDYQYLITSHADKCNQYRDAWEIAGIPFTHGTLLYLIGYINPFRNEVRETESGFVHPRDWVINNYNRFKQWLP